MHILSISVFVKKRSNNSCGNRLISKTGAGLFHACNCCRTQLSICFQLAVFHCFMTENQSEKKIQDLITTTIKLKNMSKSVSDVMLRHVSKISGLQKCIYLGSFIPL